MTGWNERLHDVVVVVAMIFPTWVDTVTPFKFAAIKVRGFEIMTYSRPFNFAVSYQNYFTASYTNVVFSYTN